MFMTKMCRTSLTLIISFVICGIPALVDSAAVKNSELECEFYNANDCPGGVCPNNRTKCGDNDPDKPSNCFVLWSVNNQTGAVEVNMKGCFTNNAACNQTECVDASYEPKKNLNFCCCKANLCNMEHKWVPTPTITVIPEVSPVEEMDIGKYYYIMLTFGVFTMLCFVIIGVYKYKTRVMFNEIPTIEPEISNSAQCLAQRPIQLIEVKARGRFGTVWKAQMIPEEVAVKIFPVQDKQSWQTEQEIFKLPRMNHANILFFIGSEKRIADSTTNFWLITAYHHNGSLCDYLKSNTVTWPELCKIAESMACGLMHLHEEIQGSKTDGLKPAIAHRDFKSKNVLLKGDLTACIADFGLALVFAPGKPCGDTHGQVGTRRYMAPEILEGAINFTRDAFLRIDVYACGLVLWELVSRCVAHNGKVSDYTLPFEIELGPHPSLEEMQENVVTKKLRPTIYDHWRSHSGLSAICDTMEECWDHDAEARLSSSCVMERVSQHRKYPTQPLLIETNGDITHKEDM